jgi:hypothetical protein
MFSTNRALYLISGAFTCASLLMGQDFEVAPVMVSFNADPGETQSRELTIRNHGSEKQVFTLNLSDYIVDEEGTKQSVAAGSTERSLADWLTVNPAFVELNPNESATADLILTVPRTGFKPRWGMVRVEVAKEQEAADADKDLATGVIIVPRIVVLVKQSPPSNRNFQGKVTGLREVESKDPVFRSFEAILENTGDNILDAKVFLALADIKTAEEKAYKSTRVTVYPGQKRRVVLILPVTPPPGNYALAFLMDYGENSAIEGDQILLDIQ